MRSFLPYRDIERPLSVLRVAGVAGAAAAVAFRRNWPSREIETAAWVVVVMVAAGTLLLWGWARDRQAERDLAGAELAGWVLDIILVFGMVWAFADSNVYVTALLPIASLTGALRYRSFGAWVGWVATAFFTGAVLVRLSDVTDAPFDRGAFAFLVGVCAVIGGLGAASAERWHQHRARFEDQAERLVELDRLRDRYIAVTSHEIRGPLSAIVTAIDTIKARWDRMTPERREALFDMVLQQGRDLDRLVSDLFVSAEVQAGGLALQPEWVDLESTISRAVDAAASKRRGHLLELFVDPMQAEIDPYRVSQVVRNLVENAYKYTADQSRVTVTAKAAAGGLHLEVADGGEGIPPDKRNQLFRAFSRIEDTAAGREGVGLGLYVVSRLIAAMNGRIDLHSSSRGTTFSMFIPCPTSPLDKPKIGLVDDEEATHG